MEFLSISRNENKLQSARNIQLNVVFSAPFIFLEKVKELKLNMSLLSLILDLTFPLFTKSLLNSALVKASPRRQVMKVDS